MLKQRLLTAAVLIAAVATAVLTLDNRWLAVVLGVVVLLGAWEWASLMNLVAPLARIVYTLLITVALWLTWTSVLHTANLQLFMNMTLGWWLVALAWLGRPQFGAGTGVAALLGKGVAGACTLVPAWAALLLLHAQGQPGIARLFFLLVMIWIADSAAYFAGSRWGRAKLAPRISPGKTRVGVYGAVAAAAVYAALGAPLLGVPTSARAGFILLCVVTVLFSVAGDLFESLFKRQHGVKDSGTLIPGHGGVLDRIDSLTAAAPIFVFGLRWLEH